MRFLRWAFVLTGTFFFALHWVHLGADFPSNSPWTDWSKYTDEGWYGDAAIRQMLFGHWYFKGDFNPGVALPVWPLLEWVAFHVTGVSAQAARGLTLCVFAVTLGMVWVLLEEARVKTRFARGGNVEAEASAEGEGALGSGVEGSAEENAVNARAAAVVPAPPFAKDAKDGPPDAAGKARGLAAPIALLLLCVSPFFYVFERMAILEPLLICEMLFALWLAARVQVLSRRSGWRTWWPSLALAALLPVMVLTKTTALFLFPAVFYIVWDANGHRMRRALRAGLPPALLGAGLWVAYYALLVSPHYAADYRYLFSANAYTGIELAPFATVILNTVSDGAWMGSAVYALFYVVLALMVWWRPRLMRNPLVPALLLWAGGYALFLAYHNNLQPRYYLVVALPVTMLVAIGLDSFRSARGPRATAIASAVVALAVLGVAIPDAMQTIAFVREPEYTLQNAFNGIRAIVLADATHPHLVLSISGSDMTLMTGLPSIDDDFGTMQLADRVKAYQPGWYAAWNQLDDDKMDALTPQYHVERVASFPAMDDADRNLLILYRLDPTIVTEALPRKKTRVPKALVTKIGQQPTTQQLQH